MKELKLLFTEAWKEAKDNPLEALGSAAAFAFICFWTYLMLIIASVIGQENVMSVEDFWWEAHNELKELGLQRKFDKQLAKMKNQEKHRYKDTKQMWEYALTKVKNEYHESKNLDKKRRRSKG